MPDRDSQPPAIPVSLLIAGESFGPGLSGEKVTEAIGRGLIRAGAPAPDLCPIVLGEGGRGALGEVLGSLDFDRRMRAARGVVIAAECLREETLSGSPAFEIATRARQAGVPAWAVTGENALQPFDARILDLQVILTAGSIRTLVLAGEKLAGLL
jgi:glycerate kinase